MELTLPVQLLPDTEQAKALRETVERFNDAANWLAGHLFADKITNRIEAQQRYYHELRQRFDLTAQTAILVIRRVCEAYKRDKTKKPKFRKHAAITYDQRVLRFQGLDGANLWTVAGRLTMPMLMGRYQRERFTTAKGQSDLVLRKDGKWFLLVTVKAPDGTPLPATDFIGVDLGVANIAFDSDGNRASGDQIEHVRTRYRDHRRELQRAATRRSRKGKRPRSIRRKLRRDHQKEARFRRDVNHRLTKTLVETAKGSGRGIALEELTHIRDRITAKGGDARHRLSGWSFGQFRSFVDYKARLAGVPIAYVDPRNTSRTCPECGHCEQANRESQSAFACRSCGHRSPNLRPGSPRLQAWGGRAASALIL